MTPHQLTLLALRVNRTTAEGRAAYEFVLRLGIPLESIRAYLEATAELATIADRLVERPQAGSWLRMAERVAGLLGLWPKTDRPVGRCFAAIPSSLQARTPRFMTRQVPTC